MSKEQAQITIEQIEKIVREEVEDYRPGGEGGSFLDQFLKGKGSKFRQDQLRKSLRQKYGLGSKKGEKLKPEDEKDSDKDKATDDDQVGYPGTEEGGEEEKKSALPKETPMSVMKKQKDVVVGQGGQKEMPLVMHIQKMGVSQSTAQAIAKRIGQYLQQRKIPIAEVVRRLEMILEQEINVPASGKEDRERDSQNRKRVGGDLRKSRERVAQLEKELAAKEASNDVGKDQAIRMIKQDLERAKKTLADYEQSLSGMKQTASDKKKERETARQATRSQIRDVGKDKGVVGKIVSRFVSDNTDLVKKDPALKAALEDPTKFNKLAKSIRDMLRRQLKRRGYEAAQIKNLLESVEPTLTLLREQRS